MNRPTLPRSILSNSTIVPALGADRYEVECWHKDATGNRVIYSPERDASRKNRRDTVRDILSGELYAIANIICANPVEHTCDLVTEDIAREVLALASDDYRDIDGALPEHIVDFCEEYLGCLAVARAQREVA